MVFPVLLHLEKSVRLCLCLILICLCNHMLVILMFMCDFDMFVYGFHVCIMYLIVTCLCMVLICLYHVSVCDMFVYDFDMCVILPILCFLQPRSLLRKLQRRKLCVGPSIQPSSTEGTQLCSGKGALVYWITAPFILFLS